MTMIEQPDLLTAARGVGMFVASDLPLLAWRIRPDWAGIETPGSLEDRWWEFHLAHPEVFDGLVRLARRAVRRGATHLGMGQLFEVLRWRTMLGARVPEEDAVRLNANHRAYFARFIMQVCPDLDGVFETRSLRHR